MPEKCRIAVCGFDPMIVKGYLKTGFRALWWHLSDELQEEYNPKRGDTIKGRVLAVYTGKDGTKVSSPDEPFEWKLSTESDLAVLLPPEAIIKYEIACSHFLELLIEKINDTTIYPGEEKMSKKWWPEDMMTVYFAPAFVAP